MRNANRPTRERERLDFAKNQDDRSDSQFDRGPEEVLSAISADGPVAQRARRYRLAVRFTSVFPIQDFRGLSQLDFVDYAIGNWECKCGHLRGLHHLRATCRPVRCFGGYDPYRSGDVICSKCGTFNRNTPTFCNKCGDPVTLQLKYDVNECQERGMTYSARSRSPSASPFTTRIPTPAPSPFATSRNRKFSSATFL